MKLINNELIRLRGLEREDLITLHKWMNDFDLTTQFLRIFPSIKCLTEDWYNKIVQNQNKIIFAIETAESGIFIGCVGLDNIDWISRKGELYIYIGDEGFQDKGYGTATLRLFLKYCFNYLNLYKIYLKVLENNKRALKLYEKLGFESEGILKCDVFLHNKYQNIIRLAKFRE